MTITPAQRRTRDERELLRRRGLWIKKVALPAVRKAREAVRDSHCGGDCESCAKDANGYTRAIASGEKLVAPKPRRKRA